MRYFIIAAMWLLLFATPARAESIADADHGYSLEIPPGWTRMPDDEIKRINTMTGRNYLCGARSNIGKTPYLLAEAFPRPNGDPAEHIDEMRKALESTGIRNADVSYDNRRNAIVMRMQVKGGSGMLDQITYGFVGKKEIIDIHCYSALGMSGADQFAFNTLADSFQFDGFHLPAGISPTMVMWIGAGACVLIGSLTVMGMVRKEGRRRAIEE